MLPSATQFSIVELSGNNTFPFLSASTLTNRLAMFPWPSATGDACRRSAGSHDPPGTGTRPPLACPRPPSPPPRLWPLVPTVFSGGFLDSPRLGSLPWHQLFLFVFLLAVIFCRCCWSPARSRLLLHAVIWHVLDCDVGESNFVVELKAEAKFQVEGGPSCR